MEPKDVDLFAVVEALRGLICEGIFTEAEARKCAAAFAADYGINAIFSL